MTKRSNLDICFAICNYCKTPRKKYEVMQKVSLSTFRTEKYLLLLLNSKLLEDRYLVCVPKNSWHKPVNIKRKLLMKHYVTTEKGKLFLERMEEIYKILGENIIWNQF